MSGRSAPTIYAVLTGRVRSAPIQAAIDSYYAELADGTAPAPRPAPAPKKIKYEEKLDLSTIPLHILRHEVERRSTPAIPARVRQVEPGRPPQHN